ncbi:MAG: hypothetical protein H8E48_10805 [Chloroflexi bacterium]|nr:hypothetical protein [Chloroflexota bacterium]
MRNQAAIIGATTWGTTLGILLAQNDVPVTMLARTETEAQTLSSQRRNARFLPDASFPDGLHVTSQPVEADADINFGHVLPFLVYELHPQDRIKQSASSRRSCAVLRGL